MRALVARLGLRARFTLAITATVAGAVVVLTVAVGVFGGWMLHSSQDLSLQREAGRAASLINAQTDYLASGDCRFATAPACTLIISDDTPPGLSSLGFAITDAQLAMTRASAAPDSRVWADATRGGVPLRVLTVPLGDGRALMVAAVAELTERSVARLNLILLLAAIGTVLGAAVVSAVVAGRTVRPIRALTVTAEHLASARDPNARAHVDRSDEIGRLAAAFDGMLDRLAAAEQARRDLIADASHDLRSPLTALTTNVELLARDDLPEQLRRRLLADVADESVDMGRLIENITALANTDSMTVRMTRFEVRELLVEVVATARRRWRNTRFDLDAGAAPTEPVLGAPEYLARAIVNLLDNAAKYASAELPIRLQVGADGQRWWVAISDDGPGIAAEDLPHIFDRHFRGGSALRAPGTGIGLAMAAQTAAQHGGTLTATSTRGEGTTVTLTLATDPEQREFGERPGSER